MVAFNSIITIKKVKIFLLITISKPVLVYQKSICFIYFPILLILNFTEYDNNSTVQS